MRKIILAQKLNGLAFEHPLGGSDVIHREDDVRADERIAIRYVDVTIGDDSHDSRQLAGGVFQAKHKHLGLRAGSVLLAKHRERRIGVVDDEANDAVVAGIGSAVAANVDAASTKESSTRTRWPGSLSMKTLICETLIRPLLLTLFRGKRGTQLERLEVDIEILLGNAGSDNPIPYIRREAEST